MFKPKQPHPMPEYSPIMVTPRPSNREGNGPVAFIGPQLCFFERDVTVELDKPIQVMVTRPLFARERDENGRVRLIALLLRPVTDEYTLIEHKGFECSGSMCSTTAVVVNDGKFSFATPGRTMVVEADNVNAGSTWKEEYEALRPGKIFAKKIEGRWRAEGLARLEDAEYYSVIRKA